MNYKQLSKITIASILNIIFAISGIILFSLDFNNWSLYGPSSLNTENLNESIPVFVQSNRSWLMLMLTMSLFLFSFIMFQITQLKYCTYKNKYLFTIGIFTWVLLPYTIYLCCVEKNYVRYHEYLSTNKEASRQFSIIHLKNVIYKNGKVDILFWNTILGLVSFASGLIAFIFSMINKYNATNEIKNYFIFNTITFFTQESNILVFIFMFMYIIFSKKILFKNNTGMICISSYISVVAIIYWALLFPKSVGTESLDETFEITKTVWLHAINPILFVSFCITSFSTNKEAPKKYKEVLSMGLIFPLFYGLYAYSLPFFTRYSVYGYFTNLNVNMTMIKNGEFVSQGNLYMIFVLIGLGLSFISFIFVFWGVSKLINKRFSKEIIYI